MTILSKSCSFSSEHFPILQKLLNYCLQASESLVNLPNINKIPLNQIAENHWVETGLFLLQSHLYREDWICYLQIRQFILNSLKYTDPDKMETNSTGV